MRQPARAARSRMAWCLGLAAAAFLVAGAGCYNSNTKPYPARTGSFVEKTGPAKDFAPQGGKAESAEPGEKEAPTPAP